MTRRILDFDGPDRFVPGTIGPPGERTFFIQARQGRALVSVSLEKQQLAVLAQSLSDLLETVQAGDPLASRGAPGEAGRSLEEPLVDAFRVGTIAVGWDPSVARVVIEATPVGAESDEPGDPAVSARSDLLRISLPAPAVEAFVALAGALLAAGRPTCPFCGEALEPDGHFCPRAILN
ncbi:MAG: DUF3090 family protein [Gemmatimonadales bacterium]